VDEQVASPGEDPVGAGAPVGWASDPHADTGPVPVVGDQPVHHTHVLHGHPHVAPPVHHEPPRHAAAPHRRRALVASGIAAVLLLAGGTAYALTRDPGSATPLAGATGGLQEGDDIDAGAPLVPGASESGSTAPLPASVPTLVLGDSLALSVYPWLADLLPDRYVSYEAEVGRSTESAADALEEVTKVPRVVIVSSGTNDQSSDVVEREATRILDELGPRRCVVWVDVVRPDTVGDPQDEVNAAIDRAVQGRTNVRVLRWSAMIEEHPEWLSGDGVHPTQEGAQARAEAFAEAASACSPLDPDAPRADQQYLPSSVFVGPTSGSGTSTGSGSGSGSGATREPSTGSTKKPKPSRSASAEPSSPAPNPTPEPTPTPTKTSDPPPEDPPDPEDPPADDA
jgi:hypothetical protein